MIKHLKKITYFFCIKISQPDIIFYRITFQGIVKITLYYILFWDLSLLNTFS